MRRMNQSDSTAATGRADAAAVRAMFDCIAPRYDLANHLLSGGIDFLWRARAAGIVASWKPRRVLDLASGSGDLALAIGRRIPEAEITAADFSEQMLAIARGKGVRRTVVADALELPFPPNSFDCVTVAFGLRNMADWNRALREMQRVLAAAGHLLVLDFSLPRTPWKGIYRAYLHHVLPRFASILTRQKHAYDYLGGSIEAFPSGAKMQQMIGSCGFEDVTAETLSAGIATIYTAKKTPPAMESERPR